ncbi:MAG TPA: AAA family ATPase [Candidatus Saccharimonadales bacterium]|nr:AAA family ATPase [Candidatus Saccharimonadales bacterium]
MKPKLKLIGLAGTNGSGKDTVGRILVEKYGYLFISITELLRDEAIRRDLPIERQTLRTISAQWRRETGRLGFLIDKAVEEYDKLKTKFPNGLVISSLRNPGEADRIHELDGTVIWVDADPKIRYERIQANAANRGRPGEDHKSFVQFLSEENAEMNQSGDAATLDMSGVKSKSDITLNNDSNSEELTIKVDNLF